ALLPSASGSHSFRTRGTLERTASEATLFTTSAAVAFICAFLGIVAIGYTSLNKSEMGLGAGSSMEGVPNSGSWDFPGAGGLKNLSMYCCFKVSYLLL